MSFFILTIFDLFENEYLFFITKLINWMDFVSIELIEWMFVLGMFSNGLVLGCIYWTVVYELLGYLTHFQASSYFIYFLRNLSSLPALLRLQSYP